MLLQKKQYLTEKENQESPYLSNLLLHVCQHIEIVLVYVGDRI